jgi:hypothetical protein
MFYGRAKDEKQDFRKHCCIATPLVAKEMGSQTHHRLTGEPPNSEDFFWKEIMAFPYPST